MTMRKDLRGLDRLEMPDLWPRIASAPPPSDAGSGSPPIPRGRRLVAAIVAFAFFGASIFVAWRVWDRSYRPEPADETPSEWAGLPEGLSVLPSPPAARDSAVVVWTGTQLIVWGGNDGFGDPPHHDDGWAFDAATRTWSSLPPAPLAPRSWAAGVWTGSEVLVWGGARGFDNNDAFADGAAYDPVRGSWRALPNGPIGADPVIGATWTGRDMVVIAEHNSAAYDPSSDAWRTIPRPSLDFTEANVLWSGSEVIVFGARQGPDGGEPPLADGMLLDPVTDTWRDLADVDLPAWRGFPGNIGIDANAFQAVWNGSRMIVVDYGLRAAAFDPTSNTWSSLPPLPTNACEGFLAAAAVASGDVMVQVCGEIVTVAPGAERWHVVLGRGEEGPQSTRFGYFLDLWGAGDVFLLFGTPFDDQGDMPKPVLWAYTPDAEVSTPSARDAWSVAAAFGGLRTHYPYDAGHIAPEVQANMDQLLAPWVADAYENRDESGLKRLWAYYYGFEVLRVEGSGPFVALVRFTGDETFTERLTLAPEVGVDGVKHPLVIVAAEPGGE
jgi:hypothetical protein